VRALRLSALLPGAEWGDGSGFFESPLQEQENNLFSIPRIDTQESRQTDLYAEPQLLAESAPFFQAPPTLYHWKKNWSLILPKGGACPNLERTGGGCTIYPDRLDTCRRPQIFPYALEDSPGTKPSKDRHTSPAVNFWRYGIAPMHRSFGRRSAPTRSSAALPPIFKWNKS
jgi:Fe-S-cluster containining protein